MRASKWASVAAIASGLAWIASAVLNWGGDPGELSYWGGLGLLLLSLAFGGYALVATAPIWLRAIVTLATPALGYTLWLVIWDSVSSGYVVVVVAGVVLIAAGAIGFARPGPDGRAQPDPPPTRGRRAAR